MKVTKKISFNDTIFYDNEHGKLHREDGPAVIWPTGTKQYWLNGWIYSYEEWLKLIPNPISQKWREYCQLF